MNATILIYSGLILLGLIGIGSRFIPGWKTDNHVEEMCEKIIQFKTDKTIDLSPDTPDPDIKEVKSKKKSK